MATVLLGRDGADGLAEVFAADYRSDMLPIPLSFEVVARRSPTLDAALDKGGEFVAGPEGTAWTVASRQQNTDWFRASAVPTAFLPLLAPATRAVIKEQTSLAAVVRACGVAVPFKGDVPLAAYSHFVGHVPSYAIASTLQQEAAGMCWQAGRLVLGRLEELMQAEPVMAIPADAAWKTDSPFYEQATVPFGFADVDGAATTGRREEARRVELRPRADVRELNNLSRVLVRDAVVPLTYNPERTAGEVVLLGTERRLILTAAHRSAGVGKSQFWLARISGMPS